MFINKSKGIFSHNLPQYKKNPANTTSLWVFHYQTILNEVDLQLFGKLIAKAIKIDKHIHRKLKTWKEYIKWKFHGKYRKEADMWYHSNRCQDIWTICKFFKKCFVVFLSFLFKQSFWLFFYDLPCFHFTFVSNINFRFCLPFVIPLMDEKLLVQGYWACYLVCFEQAT